MKTLKVGICGLGNMGMHHAMSLLKHKDIVLAAAADMEAAKRERARKELKAGTVYEDGHDMIRQEKLDAVWICAPTYLHAELTCLALEHGMHTFCEKPMGRTPQECARMQAAAKASGKFLMIGQVLRFWPEYIYLKEIVQKKKYGKLLSLAMARTGGVSIGYERWFLDEKRGGTQIFDRHIHDTDLVQWLCGTPESVRVQAVVRDRITDGGACHTFTFYEYPAGPIVCAEGSADMPQGYPFTCSYRAVFENACVEFCNRSEPTLTVYDGQKSFTPPLPKPMLETGSGLNLSNAGPYFTEQCYFFDCIRSGRRPNTVTPESAAETIRIVRAEMKAERTHRSVKL